MRGLNMTKKLSLLWQNGNTRHWYHVGNLEFTPQEFIFTYETEADRRGVKEALKDGYKLHPAFQNLHEVYRANRMFNSFARRLPNFKRKDIREKYERLGLSDETDMYDLFLVTGGKLAGDDYEFVKPIEIKDDEFLFDFYVRGHRHYQEDSYSISENDQITFESDDSNQYDTEAVKVLCNGECIGYVPAYYSKFVKRVLSEGAFEKIEVTHFDSDEPSRFRICIQVKGSMNTSQSMNEIVDEWLSVS